MCKFLSGVCCASAYYIFWNVATMLQKITKKLKLYYLRIHLLPNSPVKKKHRKLLNEMKKNVMSINKKLLQISKK